MVISMATQINLVVFSTLAGVLTGILFDSYRLLRGFENPNKFITFIEDTLFWIFTAIVVFLFLLFTNYAYMGMYVYMYIIVGLYLYIKLMSKVYIRLQYRVMKTSGRVLRIIFNILLYPFHLLLHNIKQKNKVKI